MYSNSILAVSGLLSLVAAIPMAHEHHHQHEARDYVWVTETAEAVVTVPITQTVWLEPGETAPPVVNNRPIAPSLHAQQSAPPAAAYGHESHQAPSQYVPPATSSTSQAAAPTFSSSSPPPAPPAPSPSSSSPAYVPPPVPTTSTPAPYVAPPAPTTSTSEYVPPPAPATSEAPAPSSYSPPAPASSSAWSAPAAPAQSSAAPAASAGGSGQAISNSVTGMAASGKSFSGDLTYYSVGLGSCGETSSETDNVVAVSHVIMSAYNGGNPNTNPLCGKTVAITAKDGSVHHVKIVDTCPGCEIGGLDLPEALFNTLTRVGGKVGDGREHNISWKFD